ncbi:hypothetical protein M3G50_07555 [Brachybacterium muris]|uniref:hypothetical protein n=1 Tax=Brachybacterium muris TaxID=219301 RepID=UPI0021A4CFB1|nr:hypothetical protein [Brachybacterium muris]MCT1430608.1 hypothetical protein [Brachybacterium muris]
MNAIERRNTAWQNLRREAEDFNTRARIISPEIAVAYLRAALDEYEAALNPTA